MACCLNPSGDSVCFPNECLNKPSFPVILVVNSQFFVFVFCFPTKVTVPSSKNPKLLPETKTQKGLFSDEDDSEVRNSVSEFWELVLGYDKIFLNQDFSVEV